MKNFVIMIVQMQSVSLYVLDIHLLEWFPAFEVQKTFSVSRYAMPVSDVLRWDVMCLVWHFSPH